MNRGYQIAWWLALLAVVLIQIPPALLMLLYPAINTYLASLVGECFLFVPIGIGMLLLYANGTPLAMERRYDKSRTGYYIVLPLAVSRFIILAMVPLNALLNLLFGPQPDEFMGMQTAGDILLAFAVLCIAAPVLEELLCRGVMMKLLESYGALAAIFISALIFTMMHMDIRSMAPIFFLGILFGLVRYSSGSLLACIIMHAVFNGVSLLTMLLYDLQAAWVDGLSVFFTVALAALAPVLLWRYFKTENGLWRVAVTAPGTAKIGVSVGSILFLALVVLFNGAVMINWIVSGDWMNYFSQSGF